MFLYTLSMIEMTCNHYHILWSITFKITILCFYFVKPHLKRWSGHILLIHITVLSWQLRQHRHLRLWVVNSSYIYNGQRCSLKNLYYLQCGNVKPVSSYYHFEVELSFFYLIILLSHKTKELMIDFYETANN